MAEPAEIALTVTSADADDERTLDNPLSSPVCLKKAASGAADAFGDATNAASQTAGAAVDVASKAVDHMADAAGATVVKGLGILGIDLSDYTRLGEFALMVNHQNVERLKALQEKLEYCGLKQEYMVLRDEDDEETVIQAFVIVKASDDRVWRSCKQYEEMRFRQGGAHDSQIEQRQYLHDHEGVAPSEGRGFTASDKLMYIYYVLEQEVGVYSPEWKDVVNKVVPLHDAPVNSKMLERSFGKLCGERSESERLNDDEENMLIRDHFGDEVGWYFMWTDHFGRWTAYLGILGLACQLALGADWERDMFIQASWTIVVIIWGALMLRYWRRQEAMTRNMWKIPREVVEVTDMSNWKAVSSLRLNPATLQEERYYPVWKRYMFGFFVEIPILAALVCLILFVALFCYALSTRVRFFNCMHSDNEVFDGLKSIPLLADESPDADENHYFHQSPVHDSFCDYQADKPKSKYQMNIGFFTFLFKALPDIGFVVFTNVILLAISIAVWKALGKCEGWRYRSSYRGSVAIKSVAVLLLGLNWYFFMLGFVLVPHGLRVQFGAADGVFSLTKNYLEHVNSAQPPVAFVAENCARNTRAVPITGEGVYVVTAEEHEGELGGWDAAVLPLPRQCSMAELLSVSFDITSEVTQAASTYNSFNCLEAPYNATHYCKRINIGEAPMQLHDDFYAPLYDMPDLSGAWGDIQEHFENASSPLTFNLTDFRYGLRGCITTPELQTSDGTKVDFVWLTQREDMVDYNVCGYMFRRWLFKQKLIKFTCIAQAVNILVKALVPLLLRSCLCGGIKRGCKVLCRQCKVNKAKRRNARQMRRMGPVPSSEAKTAPPDEKRVDRSNLLRLYDETTKKPFDVFKDFGEQVVLFGLVIMFSAAFPVMPLIFSLEHIFKERSDLFRLCSQKSRCVPERYAGIGAWLWCFEIVLFLGTFVSVMVWMVALCNGISLVNLNAAVKEHIMEAMKVDTIEQTYTPAGETIRLYMEYFMSMGGIVFCLCCELLIRILVSDKPEWLASAEDVEDAKSYAELELLLRSHRNDGRFAVLDITVIQCKGLNYSAHTSKMSGDMNPYIMMQLEKSTASVPANTSVRWDTMDPQWDSSADVDKDGKADAKATFVVNDANDTLRLAIFSRRTGLAGWLSKDVDFIGVASLAMPPSRQPAEWKHIKEGKFEVTCWLPVQHKVALVSAEEQKEIDKLWMAMKGLKEGGVGRAVLAKTLAQNFNSLPGVQSFSVDAVQRHLEDDRALREKDEVSVEELQQLYVWGKQYAENEHVWDGKETNDDEVKVGPAGSIQVSVVWKYGNKEDEEAAKVPPDSK